MFTLDDLHRELRVSLQTAEALADDLADLVAGRDRERYIRLRDHLADLLETLEARS